MDAVIPAATERRQRRTLSRQRRALVVSGLVALVLVVSALAGWYHRSIPLPDPPPAGPWPRFRDLRRVEVITTVNWRKIPVVRTREQFLVDLDVWQRMHFEDWDRLPPDVRASALDRVLAAYGVLVTARAAWPAMTADDWDQIPQPVRAMAFVTMIEHWVEFYDVGGSFDLPRSEVLDTVKAIAMSESWFNHRASAVNADGSVDIGLGGASGFARRTIRRWYDAGRCDFTMTDDQYQDPWLATRWMAFWFDVMLQEAVGDVTLATRAWNWGIGRAAAGAGDDYLAAVQRRRRRYFEGPSHSPTWRRLSAFRRAQQDGGRVTSMQSPLAGPSPTTPAPVPGH